EEEVHGYLYEIFLVGFTEEEINEFWSLDEKVWHFDLKYKEATDMGEEEQAVYFKNKRDKIFR
ncbi:22074_t:CDS:2, partial [Gigaspora margarita]